MIDERDNFRTVELLKAYDKNLSKEFLKTARQLLEWLKTQPNFIRSKVFTINELQIVLRERTLNFDEKATLHAIISSTDDDFFRIGAFLLLDEQYEAKKILDNLTKEELKAFKNFPIYTFYKLDDEEVET